MRRKCIPLIIIGLALFVAGLIVMEHSGIGILLMLAGIAAMIFGSVLMMGITGKLRTNYFDNGVTFATDQPSVKEKMTPES